MLKLKSHSHKHQLKNVELVPKIPLGRGTDALDFTSTSYIGWVRNFMSTENTGLTMRMSVGGKLLFFASTLWFTPPFADICPLPIICNM